MGTSGLEYWSRLEEDHATGVAGSVAGLGYFVLPVG